MVVDAVEDRSVLADLPLLCAIPLALVLVHVLVPSARRTLVFDHSQLDPLRMWTSAYVHLDAAHLRSNLLGYGIAVLPLYTLYRTWDRRREFWLAVGVLLLVGPWVISTGSHLVFQHVFYGLGDVVTRGFSGIVGGLAGLLWASIPAYVASEYGRWRAVEVGLVAVLVPLVAVLLNVAAPSVVTLGVVSVGIVVGVANVVPRELWSDPAGLEAVIREEWLAIATVSYCVIAVGFLLVNLFPSVLVKEESMTNLFGHFIGIVFGILIVVSKPR